MTEEQGKIVIRGARTHNLKNIQIDLPRNKLIVITGLSGSGKSSLAFDTLYAEGQRRYVESAVGLRAPVFAADGKTGRRSDRGAFPCDRDRPESVVAQSAFDDRDRYGNLRLPASFVRSRRNTFLSGTSGENPLAAQSVSQMVDAVMAMPEGHAAEIMALSSQPER